MPYLLLTLSALFWSGNFVVSRAVSTMIPPATLVFWRWVVALVVLLPIVLPKIKHQWPILRKNLLFVALCGLMGVTLFNLLIYTAVQTTTAINAVLVNSAIPVLIILFARIILKQSISWQQWTGIMLSLAGVATIILRGNITALLNLTFSSGDLLVLAAAAAWAIYSVALRRYPQGLDPYIFLFGMVVCGLVFLLPVYALEISSGKLMELNSSTILTIGYVGIFASVAAFAAWNSGLRAVGPQVGGQFVHLMPVFSTILAVLFLDERLHLFHLSGIALIVSGILCTTLTLKQKS